ncbi:MAG: arsenate reductase [Gammaproteobacteria bacterium]
MKVTLYGLASCDSCRRARRWLETRGVDFRFHDLRETPPSTGTLDRWARAAGWERLLNRRSTTWRALPPAQREGLDKNRAVTLMAAHPTLVKRPVLEAGEKLSVGIDEVAWQRIIEP